MIGKRGSMTSEEMVFVILNIIFFFILLFFVVTTSSNAAVFEHFYAKKIALLIDGAKPGTVISLDVSQGVEVAEKNSVRLENTFDFKDGFVYVKLSSREAYRFPVFNDVKIDDSFQVDSDGTVKLVIGVENAE
jgi:hypothetical protein